MVIPLATLQRVSIREVPRGGKEHVGGTKLVSWSVERSRESPKGGIERKIESER